MNRRALFIICIFTTAQAAASTSSWLPHTKEQEKITKKLSGAPEETEKVYSDIRTKCREYNGTQCETLPNPIQVDHKKKKANTDDWKKTISCEPKIQIKQTSNTTPFPFCAPKNTAKE